MPNTTFPVPLEKYKDLSFDLYSLILPSYNWLDETFSTCYRFMPASNAGTQVSGRLLKMVASNAGAVSFDQEYGMDYDMDRQRLHITFIDDRYEVESVKIFYGNITAIILSLTASDGTNQCFYAAPSHPFSAVYRKIYDV